MCVCVCKICGASELLSDAECLSCVCCMRFVVFLIYSDEKMQITHTHSQRRATQGQIHKKVDRRAQTQIHLQIYVSFPPHSLLCDSCFCPSHLIIEFCERCTRKLFFGRPRAAIIDCVVAISCVTQKVNITKCKSNRIISANYDNALYSMLPHSE